MRIASCIVLLSLVACLSKEAPGAPPSGDLDGKWGWDQNGNPGGSSINITFVTAGPQVTGSGAICGIGPHCNPGAVTITGDHTPTFGPFHLTVRGPGGFKATYSGQFVGPDRLQGSWTSASNSYTVTLNRCGPTSFCW